MKYMAIIDADEKPVSCEFIGCNGNVSPYLIGAITDIKELEQEPIWIPVSERLPEERGVYIVTEKVFRLDDREHKGRYNTMVEQVEYCNGKWQRASFFEVVAWMPLPKPYKAGGSEHGRR